MTIGGYFSVPRPLPFEVPQFNPLYNDLRLRSLRPSTCEIQTRFSNRGSLRLSNTSMIRNSFVTTTYRLTSAMMPETNGVNLMFAAIGFKWLVAVSEAIKKNPEVAKGPIEKILTAILALVPKWFSPLAPLAFLMFMQAATSRKEKPERISFGDLVGLAKAKASLDRVMKTLRGDPPLARLGEKSPNGVLLFGPENTGKKTLVNALAYDSKVAYIPITATDIAREGASKGIATIQSLFLEARMYAPCIIYIEDVDAIAEKKTAGCDPILRKLLTELEKCYRDERLVIVIGSTTKKRDELDKRLTKSPLFLEEVHVEMPDEDARRGFVDLYLGQHLEEKFKDQTCTLIVSETKHFVRSDIKKVCLLAKDAACKRDSKLVTPTDVIEALAKVKSDVTTSVAPEEQVTK